MRKMWSNHHHQQQQQPQSRHHPDGRPRSRRRTTTTNLVTTTTPQHDLLLMFYVVLFFLFMSAGPNNIHVESFIMNGSSSSQRTTSRWTTSPPLPRTTTTTPRWPVLPLSLHDRSTATGSMMIASQRPLGLLRRRVRVVMPTLLLAARTGDEDIIDEEEEEEDEDDQVNDDDDNENDDNENKSTLLTDERKANLFQFLLRDLQVEGVPLLGIDADQVQTLQAAIWTTMAGLLATAVGGSGGDDDDDDDDDDAKEEVGGAAEPSWLSSIASSDADGADADAKSTTAMSSSPGDEPKQQQKQQQSSSSTTGRSTSTTTTNNNNNKVCLVFEEIPIDALSAFVQDFQMVQNDPLIQQNLPELLAFRIALVGNGVGPALTITIQLDDAAANTFQDHVNPLAIIDKTYAGENVLRATAAFVERVVQTSDDAIGMKQPAYRYCGFADACHALSAFWNCLCELQAKPDLPSIMLSFPIDFDPALTTLMNRSLCLYRGQDVLELVHYGPSYDRSMVEPQDQPALGHLPPLSWLDPVMAQYGEKQDDDDDDVLAPDRPKQELGSVANFQRRAPVGAVLIKRVELMNQEAKDNPLATSSDLILPDGTTKVAVFGLPLLAKSIQKLTKIGTDQLEASLDQEIAMIMG